MGEGDQHLDLRVLQYGTRLRAIAFGRGNWAEQIRNAPGPLSISFAAAINRYRGRESVELQLVDCARSRGRLVKSSPADDKSNFSNTIAPERVWIPE